MKKIFGVIAVTALCVFVNSCGVLGLGAGTGTGSKKGQASGAALKSLYSQYSTDGRVDLSNLNNVISMAQLVNGIQGLKGIDDKSSFYRDFAAGLILGSDNLVTKTTSNPVTGTLATLVNGTDLSALAAAGVAAAAQSSAGNTVTNTAAALSETTTGVANTLQSLSTIFNMFGAE